MSPGENELADIARLSVTARSFGEALSRFVRGPRVNGASSAGLGSAGSMFRWPLLIGLRAYLGDNASAAAAFRDLGEWQAHVEIIFSPERTYLGLSPEFDLAIVEFAPPVFCIVAMLFLRDADAARQLCQQLYARATDGTLAQDWVCYALAWCVIASLKVRAHDVGQLALDGINRRGGLPTGAFPLLAGPSLSEEGPTAWELMLASSPRMPTPSLPEIDATLQSLTPAECGLPELVARILTDDEFTLGMNDLIVRMRPQCQ
jgi:hypothetical protein